MEVTPRLVLPGVEDHRTYWVKPPQFPVEGAIEFSLHRTPKEITLTIPSVGPRADPQVPAQPEWVNRNLGGLAETRSSEWSAPSEAVAKKVERVLLSLGWLREWSVRTNDPETAPDVIALRPADATDESMEWRLRGLPGDDPHHTRTAHLIVSRRSKIFAWCAVYPKDSDEARPSKWFREATRRGLGPAELRVDGAHRILDGFRLNDAGLRDLCEEALGLPEEMFDLLQIKWTF